MGNSAYYIYIKQRKKIVKKKRESCMRTPAKHNALGHNASFGGREELEKKLKPLFSVFLAP